MNCRQPEASRWYLRRRRIVMVEQVPNRSPQQGMVHRLQLLEQHALIEVMRIGQNHAQRTSAGSV